MGKKIPKDRMSRMQLITGTKGKILLKTVKIARKKG
jgi:hypothetical protein